jgi:transmembrane sensor
MDSGNFWILLGKKLSGEANTDELREFERILNSDIRNIYPLEVLENYWRKNKDIPPAPIQKLLENKWERFERKLEASELDITVSDPVAEKPKVRFLQYFSVLIIVFIVFIGILYWNPGTQSPLHANEITAPEKGISKVKLPDGTKVWLNSGSRLTYKNDFGETLREVHLSGEAYFDVVKDTERPFIVNTETISLKVLGTAFNVRSYQDEEVTEAALIHGKIEVKLLNNSGKEITLKPSEKLVVSNRVLSERTPDKANTKELVNALPLITLDYIHQSESDSLPSEALWLENRLAFDSETFIQVANRLERWYGVEIAINNAQLRNLKFTGKFKDESLEEALKALQATSDFKYTINNKQVIIK